MSQYLDYLKDRERNEKMTHLVQTNNESIDEFWARVAKAEKMMKTLEIPFSINPEDNIPIIDALEFSKIFEDPEKLDLLIFKLKNKAFL